LIMTDTRICFALVAAALVLGAVGCSKSSSDASGGSASASAAPSASAASAKPSASAATAASASAAPKASASAAASAAASASGGAAGVTDFSGDYSFTDGENAGPATITQDGDKVTIKYGIGTATCKAVGDKLTACSWWESSGASGGANFTRTDNGGLKGAWYTSDGSGGGWTFTPKPK
jgi:hypothetical protein